MSWIKLVVNHGGGHRAVGIIGRASRTYARRPWETVEESVLALREFLTRRGWKRQWGHYVPQSSELHELWFHKKYHKPTPVWNPDKK